MLFFSAVIARFICSLYLSDSLDSSRYPSFLPSSISRSGLLPAASSVQFRVTSPLPRCHPPPPSPLIPRKHWIATGGPWASRQHLLRHFRLRILFAKFTVILAHCAVAVDSWAKQPTNTVNVHHLHRARHPAVALTLNSTLGHHPSPPRAHLPTNTRLQIYPSSYSFNTTHSRLFRHSTLLFYTSPVLPLCQCLLPLSPFLLAFGIDRDLSAAARQRHTRSRHKRNCKYITSGVESLKNSNRFCGRDGCLRSTLRGGSFATRAQRTHWLSRMALLCGSRWDTTRGYPN